MKVAILTNIIPTYRRDFYNRVFSNNEHDVTVFCTNKIPGSNVKSIHEIYGKRVALLKYFAPFNNEKLVFHFLPVLQLWQYDVLVVDGNVRHVSMALLSSIFKLFGKKIVVWSNVYSAHGNPFLQKIRRKWWNVFSNFLMYTERDVILLHENGFENKNIIAINNGLNQEEIDLIRTKWTAQKINEFKEQNNIISKEIILSSGRINKINNHILALEAVEKLNPSIPNLLWVVIGDGTETEKLKEIVSEKNLQDNVLFLGEIYEEENKCPWFLSATVLIHPGYMGLTIFNSFGYSLPVIIHDNLMNHSPEVFLFEENKTGLLFKENDSNDLANKIALAIDKKDEIDAMKINTYSIVKNNNNTKIMAQQFFKMINSLV